MMLIILKFGEHSRNESIGIFPESIHKLNVYEIPAQAFDWETSLISLSTPEFDAFYQSIQ